MKIVLSSQRYFKDYLRNFILKLSSKYLTYNELSVNISYYLKAIIEIMYFFSTFSHWLLQ